MEKVKLLNVSIDNLSMSELLEKLRQGGVVFTPNVDHLVKLHCDKEFNWIYHNADYRVCDSQIIWLVSKFLGQPLKEKISGSDLFPAFYHYYKTDETIKIFLLGAPEGVAQTAQEIINGKVNRQIVVATYAPPLGFENDEEECQKVIELINNSGATVVAVGLGAPKQEKWIFNYKNQLENVKVFLAIGASIGFEAGYYSRAPKWMSNGGLEWFYRLLKEPKRLWKRYLVESFPFFVMIVEQKLKSKVYQRNKPMPKLKVIMVGPSLEEKGGMGSVQTLIMDSATEEFHLEHISTWDGSPSKLRMVKVFAGSVVTFFGKLLGNQGDIIHIHLAERGSVVRKAIIAFIAWAWGKPVIMHTHGCEFHLFYHNLPKSLQQALNWVLQRCTYLIVLSESWQEFYLSHCGLKPERVIVLPNPVVMPSQVPERGSSDPVRILFLGKINQRKGVFDFLRAFAQLPASLQKRVELILAGSGETEQVLELLESLDINQQVTLPGWVNSQQKEELLAVADIFLLPSYNEGLPMALLEAMSWGLPAITTPVGGIGEVVIHQETGWLVNPGDISSLTQAMKTLIEDVSLRLSLGKAARAKIASFDIKNYSSSLFDLYRSTMVNTKYQQTEISWIKEQLEYERNLREQLSQDWEKLNAQVGYLQSQLEKQQHALKEALKQLEEVQGEVPVTFNS